MRVRVALAGGRVDVRAGCTGAWVLDARWLRGAQRAAPTHRPCRFCPSPYLLRTAQPVATQPAGIARARGRAVRCQQGFFRRASLQGCGCGLQTLSRLPFAVSVICSVAIATSCRESEGIGARVPAGMPLAGG